MSWHDLLNPNRIVERVFRWFCYVLALLLLVPLGVRLIADVPFLGVALMVCFAAYIADAVRNRQTKPTRARIIGRAERTPIMPIEGGDE